MEKPEINPFMLWKIPIKKDDNRSDGISKKCNCQDPIDHRIGHNRPFYHCKEHPKVQNINWDSIIHHILYSTNHKLS
jgi:hypothetical protein